MPGIKGRARSQRIRPLQWNPTHLRSKLLPWISSWKAIMSTQETWSLDSIKSSVDNFTPPKLSSTPRCWRLLIQTKTYQRQAMVSIRTWHPMRSRAINRVHRPSPYRKIFCSRWHCRRCMPKEVLNEKEGKLMKLCDGILPIIDLLFLLNIQI